jgi:hypothetical protein
MLRYDLQALAVIQASMRNADTSRYVTTVKEVHMSSLCERTPLFATAMLLALSACAGSQTSVPSGAPITPAMQAFDARSGVAAPDDTTSILKKLVKDVVIGSTVDSSNGDQGPRAISVATSSKGVIKAGQVLVCNFDDKSGTAGEGTTIELLDPKPGSKATTFTQSSELAGCDGDAFTHAGDVYGAAFTAADLVEIDSSGKITKTYKGALFKEPFDDTFATAAASLAPAYVYSTDAELGTIVSTQTGFYGDGLATQVINGFAVNKGSAGTALGPSGPQYNKKVDTLYAVDGVTNTLVEFDHASNLLETDEITVESGGTKFKCKHADVTCGKLIKSGSPLDKPMAMTLLPNGNLIIANTGGTANTLVEITTTGQVLDTKVIDKSSTQGVFGLYAIGTTDANTALYYTDTNDNNLHELEQ